MLLDRMGRTAEAVPLLERAVEIDRQIGLPALERDQRALDELRGKLGGE